MTDARDPLAEALRELLGGVSVKSDAADFRAILARHGLAVVLVEPTEEMKQHFASNGGRQALAWALAAWPAMLAAAQEAQRDG